MEASIIPVEENAASKSSGSLIQINSISIDLQFPKEKIEIDNCQHNFSILGYAAQMRVKNPKNSNPFPSNGDVNDSEEQLPPLPVPKFRWWSCPECRRNISTGTSTSTSHEAAMVLLETQPNPTPVSTHVEPKDINTGDVAATGAETEPIEPVGDTTADVGDEDTVSEIGCTTGNETGISDKVIPNTAIVELPGDLPKSSDGCSSKMPPEENKSTNGKEIAKTIPSTSANSISKNDEVTGARPDVGFAPLEVEGGNSSSETESDCSQHDSSGLSRRKIRKVRLLTELLGDRAELAAFGGPQHRALYEENGRAEGDSEKTVTEDGVPGSEGHASASSGVGLQIGQRTDRLKRRTEKAPAILKKKNKQHEGNDRISPIQPLEGWPRKRNVNDCDLQICSSSANIASAAGKSDDCSRGFKSPPEIDREKVDVPLPAPVIHDRSSRVGFDLSLGSFPDKIGSLGNQDKGNSGYNLLKKNDIRFGPCSILPTSQQDQMWRKRQVLDLNVGAVQNSSNIFDSGSFSLLKEMDFLQVHGKEKTVDVQGFSKGLSKQSDHRDGKAPAQGSADDIPMEIVELMAKNQYERGLGNAGNYSFPRRPNDTLRRFNEVQGTSTINDLAKGFSALSKFPSDNARARTIASENVRGSKGSSMNFSQIGGNHFKMGQAEKNNLSIFTAFPQHQQILPAGLQFSAAASDRTGSRSSEGAEPLFSSITAKMPFGPGIQQKFSVSNPESHHKGKTISDIKADEIKRTQEAHLILPKEGGSDHRAKGPLDPYANENIPAMQLLSLMDGRSPGTFFVGTSKAALDKPFAPSCYHSRFMADERRGILNGSLFLRQSHAKEASGLGTGLYSSRESSGRHSFVLSGQPSLKLQEQDKLREKSRISVSASGVLHTGQSSSQGKGKQKAVVNASDSFESPNQHHGFDCSRSMIDLEAECNREVVMPLRIIPGNEFCSFNRNPAEFSVPEAGNVFTISGRDLKFRKRKYSRERSSPAKVEGPKRQRVAKAKSGKEQAHLA